MWFTGTVIYFIIIHEAVPHEMLFATLQAADHFGMIHQGVNGVG